MERGATQSVRETVDYEAAQAAQRALVERRRGGGTRDLLWLVEHPPTITWGSSGGQDHLLAGLEAIRARGIALCSSERGGDVTFHEPGQLVGYLIVDIGGAGDRDLHRFLRSIEEGLIRFLRGLGIESGRVPGHTGVWIDGSPRRKIAAMGLKAKGWITSHGFALNVENLLQGFGLIIPCGIQDAAVTSIARELAGRRLPAWDAVARGVHAAMEEALGRPLWVLNGREGLREGSTTVDPPTRAGASASPGTSPRADRRWRGGRSRE